MGQICKALGRLLQIDFPYEIVANSVLHLSSSERDLWQKLFSVWMPRQLAMQGSAAFQSGQDDPLTPAAEPTATEADENQATPGEDDDAAPDKPACEFPVLFLPGLLYATVLEKSLHVDCPNAWGQKRIHSGVGVLNVTSS